MNCCRYIAAVFGKTSVSNAMPAGDIGLINFYFWIYTHFINSNNNNILNSEIVNYVVRLECLERMGRSSLIRLNSSNGSFSMWNRLKCHTTIKIATLINCECVEMLMANGIWKWAGIRNSKNSVHKSIGTFYTQLNHQFFSIRKWEGTEKN